MTLSKDFDIKSRLNTKQDSRDSSPKPSSNMLDSLCPNCSEHLSQASHQSSKMLSNAQQCSKML